MYIMKKADDRVEGVEMNGYDLRAVELFEYFIEEWNACNDTLCLFSTVSTLGDK